MTSRNCFTPARDSTRRALSPRFSRPSGRAKTASGSSSTAVDARGKTARRAMSARRADIALVERGFFASRAKAREAIEAGLVRQDGRAVTKPSQLVARSACSKRRRPTPGCRAAASSWRRRSTHFPSIRRARARSTSARRPAASRMCFCHAASSMSTCVDVGHGQLHPTIAADTRIKSLEKRDARALRAADLPEGPAIDRLRREFYLAWR